MTLEITLAVGLTALGVTLYTLKKIYDLNAQFKAHFEIQNRALLSELQSQQNYLHERLHEMDRKLLQQSAENRLQIENQHTLFKEILTAHTHFKEALLNRFEAQSTKTQHDYEKLTSQLDKRLEHISNRVDERLTKGFESVDKTFKEIITSVSRISEAQKSIQALSSEVVSLQSVLSDKKSRGIFGEVQLEGILHAIFGEQSPLYHIQHTLKHPSGSTVIADATIQAPSPVGLIAIDSKFPLENYTRMCDNRNHTEYNEAKRAFKLNLKKHIDDIATKYIIKNTTAEMAVLFLPAEAIFAELNAYHQDIIDYAQSRNVWIASPTTLMALLTTVQAIVRDIRTKEEAKAIQEELIKLSSNFTRYKERWERLVKHIDTVGKDVKEISTTTDKIASAFERIERVELDASN